MAKKPRSVKYGQAKMSEAVFEQMLEETFVVLRSDHQCLMHPLDRTQIFVSSNRIFVEQVAKETKGTVMSLKQAMTEQLRREAKQAGAIIDAILANQAEIRKREAKVKAKKKTSR